MSLTKIVAAFGPTLRRTAFTFPTAGFAAPSFHTVRLVAEDCLTENPAK
ncbi:MAG: hypothetical protein QM582_01505 [Micropruina sp.]